MFPQAIFISYIVMIVIGLQGVSLIIILVKLFGNKSDRIFTANRNFLLVSLLLGILYFITYYNDLVIGDFATGLLYRLFDGAIFYALGLSWIKVIDGFISSESEKSAALKRYTNIIFVFMMVVSSLSYGIYLDELYYAANVYTLAVIMILELMLVFIVLIATVVYMKKAADCTLDKSSKKYLTVVSILVNISVIWNSLVAISIFLNFMHVSILSMYSYGVTSVFMLIINACVLVYTYRKNAEALYGRKTEPALAAIDEIQKEKSIDERIQNATAAYKLTERESEILRLAYTGLTNPEIGDLLCISKHTAKRHMHNIFEKLQVTTRMEMVHFINGKG